MTEATTRAHIEAALASLAVASGSPGAPFRHLQLATGGRAPDVRTVVLRGFDRATRLLEFHSDRRAGKIAALAREPRAALVGWSDAIATQIRLHGRATIHAGDPVAVTTWSALSPGARRAYAYRAAPGAPVAPEAAEDRVDAAEALLQFVVVRILVETVDVLRLGPHGAQWRAIGRFDATGGIRAERVGA